MFKNITKILRNINYKQNNKSNWRDSHWEKESFS